MRAVLASNNAGKLRELTALLDPLGLALVAQTELGIGAPDETGVTFVENALIKARHAALASGLAAIADDSGLVVPALDGAPGVHSARYAGPEADAAANNAKLAVDIERCVDRRAHYYCVVVMLRHHRDPAPLIATGRWDGAIETTPAGSGGFGYDPYFRPAGMAITAAQLTPEDKNHVSHRGQAARRLAALLQADALL